MAGVGLDGGAGWGWGGRGHHRDDGGRRRMTHHNCEVDWIPIIEIVSDYESLVDDGDGSYGMMNYSMCTILRMVMD